MSRSKDAGAIEPKSRSADRSSSIGTIMFIAGFTLSMFMAMGSLTWPMSDDHLHYAFVGDAILEGRVPYREAWDLKGPLTYYVYGWTRALLGRTEWSIRLVDLAVVLIFCLRMRALVLRLSQSLFGANFAVLFFVLCYFCGGYYWTAQPDDWGGMLILASISFLVDENRGPYFKVIAAGTALAAAILLKPTFALFAPLMLLYHRQGDTRVLTRVKTLSVGMGVIILTVGTAYLWVFRHGGFQDLIDALRFVSAAYGSPGERLSSQRIFSGFDAVIALGVAIPYLLAPVGLFIMGRSGQRPETRILGAWFALSIVMIAYQGMYWYYEFMPATIAAAVIIGSALGFLERLNEASLARAAADGALLLMIGLICVAPLAVDTIVREFYWPGYVLGIESDEHYKARVSDYWDRRQSIEELSAYLLSHTVPNDRVQFWGWVSGLGAITLTGRKTATRFGDTWAVMTETPLKRHYRQVFMQDLSRTPPRCLIVDTNYFISEPVSEFPEFHRFIHSHYQLVGHVAEFQMWCVAHEPENRRPPTGQ